MHKGLIILADGFEDVEALGTVDIIRRSGLLIDTVGLESKNLLTQSNNKLTTDKVLKEINLNEYDFLVIPGGKAVFNKLDNNQDVSNLIDYFYNENKLIAAICAAPRLLEKKGLFKDLDFTIFPNCLDLSKEIIGNNTEKELVINSKFITARSMYYTTSFALAIVNYFLGPIKTKTLEKQLMGK